jgi:fatty-acyl-CoA synthase
MQGLMMRYPLTLEKILLRARDVHSREEIVSRLADEKSEHRYTYGDFYRRVLRLMHALRKLGVQPGDRIASFAWNHYRHMELYFAAPCVGAVVHTLNIRLTPDQLAYIVNHAEDRLIFVDASLVQNFGAAAAAHSAGFASVQNLVRMDDLTAATGDAYESDDVLPGAPTLDYEELILSGDETEDFAALDEEDAAGLCYTSGTTGEPKGVLYSHRSLFLHAMGMSLADTLGLGMRDTLLPVVPMFHVNAWGLPFATVMCGAKMAFPGPHLSGKALAEFMERERVTLAAGVPTIWNMLYQHLKRNQHDLSSLRGLVVGGAAMPRSLIANFAREFQIPVIHGWGMTETSPIGSLGTLRRETDAWSEDERFDLQAKQGLPLPLVEFRLVNDEGEQQPFDGKSAGELQVRGAWVARAYYRNDSAQAREAFVPDSLDDCNKGSGEDFKTDSSDGWFRTGDVATIDELSYMQITDRKKDLIKTRGEWISSVEMENYAMSHPGVFESAVIGRFDEIRSEAPVVFVIVAPETDAPPDAREILDHLSHQFAPWQLPKLKDIVFVDQLPKSSTGKFDKKALRLIFQDARPDASLPSSAATKGGAKAAANTKKEISA